MERKNILLLGRSGSGKTALFNRVKGFHLSKFVSYCFQGSTGKVRKVETKKYTYYDTPEDINKNTWDKIFSKRSEWKIVFFASARNGKIDSSDVKYIDRVLDYLQHEKFSVSIQYGIVINRVTPEFKRSMRYNRQKKILVDQLSSRYPTEFLHFIEEDEIPKSECVDRFENFIKDLPSVLFVTMP